MAKDASVAPKERINVTFKPSHGNVQEDVELPLKLMVLGDFTQRRDTRVLEERKPIQVDKGSFDEVLAKQEIRLEFNVPNRLQEADEAGPEDLAVALQIDSLNDFHPSALVQRVPELARLMELRDALVALKGPLGNTPAFRRAIETALGDEASRARVLAELGLQSEASDDE